MQLPSTRVVQHSAGQRGRKTQLLLRNAEKKPESGRFLLSDSQSLKRVVCSLSWNKQSLCLRFVLLHSTQMHRGQQMLTVSFLFLEKTFAKSFIFKKPETSVFRSQQASSWPPLLTLCCISWCVTATCRSVAPSETTGCRSCDLQLPCAFTNECRPMIHRSIAQWSPVQASVSV